MSLIKDVSSLPNTLYWYPLPMWVNHRQRVEGEKTVWVIDTDKIAAKRDQLFVCPHRDVETLRRKAKDNHLDVGTHCFVEFGPLSFLVNGCLTRGQIHGDMNTHQTVVDFAYSGALLAFKLLFDQHPDAVGVCGIGHDVITEGVTHLAGVKVLGKGAIFSQHSMHFFLTSLAHRHGLQVMGMGDVKAEGVPS